MMDRKSVNKEVFQVSRWIYQELIGNLSDKNREALEAWRKAHPDNEKSSGNALGSSGNGCQQQQWLQYALGVFTLCGNGSIVL